MFSKTPEEIVKLNEAMDIFKSLRPEFQDYALEQIRKLAKLQDKT